MEENPIEPKNFKNKFLKVYVCFFFYHNIIWEYNNYENDHMK